ncbi:DNA polymerase III subunit epsilon [Thauera sp. CAU 1555]|uniref:DNA polymerase III subunit epsilon n=1 Tax=Thauera sedimentorum TaxID=2767595 RepID=A0ABR9B8D3_9RHOO|nr:DNA polymerase III subunit epsilon [Thauera sedimentorum]MBC9071517.1 DNA polymerase III subunit epsilon [Thauera sedimentorum]MBD8502436.1 DNA polymerase III subunit epsilon [Thauera sedimentorum]
MRQIVLDTETTGLDWRNGDRVIEIGCVELVNRSLTGRHYHVYINPERGIDAEAVAVHGITEDFLADKPRFADVAADFEAFVRDAELVIHNASFDVGFLNHELSRLGRPALDALCAGVIDTLKMAKEQNPGKKASLDALCGLYQVDNGHRTLHGALLDAEILAEVYLAMTRGQESLIMALDEPAPGSMEAEAALGERPVLAVLRASEDELAAHAAVLQDIAKATKGQCLWLPPEPAEAEAGAA